MSHITLLMGPNHYAIQQERRRWVEEFKKRQGEDSLFLVDAKQITFKELQNECQIAPFLAEKRLLVVQGVPSRGSKEDVQALPKLLHPQAVLLFTLPTDGAKKPKLTIPAKALGEIAQIVEFPQLSTTQREQWIAHYAKESGAESIEPAATKLLLQMVGEDQGLLASEITKLAIYAHARQIAVADVELLASSSAERDVWQLMDYLGAGKIEDTLRFTYSLLDRGYSPQALWSTFVWMLTVLTSVVAIIETGETNPWKIAGTVRANPYSVKAILPFARSLPLAKLEHILQTALDADIGLKTGAYKATSDAPEEILALIDRSIVSFA